MLRPLLSRLEKLEARHSRDDGICVLEVLARDEDSPAVGAADLEARKQDKRLVVITRYEMSALLQTIDGKSRGLPSNVSAAWETRGC